MSDKIIPFPLPLALNPPVRVPVEDLTRDQAIKRIRDALKLRSGKPWSVTGGTGTAWGWIRIDAPPARRTSRQLVLPGKSGQWPEDYEKQRTDTGETGGSITEAEAGELAALLGVDSVHHQGVSIPSGSDYWIEYVDRAEGREPRRIGIPYWD